jgi:MATE family multidrug resistance protein
MATTTIARRPTPTSGPSIHRQTFNLALPAVGEQLLNTLVGMADVFLVGNLSIAAAQQLGYTSAIGLTGVGLGNQFSWLAMVFFMAVGIATTALVARSVGAKDGSGLQRILRQALILATVVGVITSIGGQFLGEVFLRVLNTPAEALPTATNYIQITALAFLPTALLFAGNAALRGAGDTRTPLFVMLGVNGTNILVTWLLVNGQFGLPVLGVEGAAIGTALARGGGGIVVVLLLLRGLSNLKLEPTLRPDPTTLQRMFRLAAPTAGEMLIFHGALLIFVRFVTGLGTSAYAAHNITITIESLSFLPGLGYAAATGALVGQALGARDPQRAEDYAFAGLLQGGLMMTLVGASLVFFPNAWLGLFTNDPTVIAAAEAPLRAAGLVQPALATSFIVLGALRGAGDTRWPLLSRLITTWAIRLPLTLLLVWQLDLGLPGIWLAMCTDFTLQAILALWRFQSGAWKRIEV